MAGTVSVSSRGGKSFLFQWKSDGGTVLAAEAWTNKATGYMWSPMVIDGLVDLQLQNQRFTCIDLANGKSHRTT